MELPRMTRFE